MAPTIRAFCALLCIVVMTWPLRANACTPDWCMTHNHLQYALVLGMVTRVDGTVADIAVNEVLMGNPVFGTIRVHKTRPHPEWNKLKPYDYVYVSVNKEGVEYNLAYDIRRVTSLDTPRLKFIPEPQYPEEAALQWWINYGGDYGNIGFVGNTAYAIDARMRCTQIYPTSALAISLKTLQKERTGCLSLVLAADSQLPLERQKTPVPLGDVRWFYENHKDFVLDVAWLVLLFTTLLAILCILRHRRAAKGYITSE